MDNQGKATSKLPGNEGIWVFLIADLIIFMFYFAVFSMGRFGEPELFEAGRRQLEPLLAFANTLVLLTSSYFVARAVDSARDKDPAATRRDLIIAIALGVVFVAVKITGYIIDLSHFSIGSNVFFTYYFAITGIHCAHVIVGTVLLLVCFAKTFKNLKKKNRLFIESCALFWHMVDLLWVMIFPMIYLMGGIA